MKNGLKSFLATVGKRVVIDTGIIFEILSGTEAGKICQEMLFNSPDIGEHWITDLGFTEILYLLCRSLKSGELTKAIKQIKNLVEISTITDLTSRAGNIKCKFPISIPDCFNIALAEKIEGKAIFKHEKEINDVLKKTNEKIDSCIVFIDDFTYYKNQFKPVSPNT